MSDKTLEPARQERKDFKLDREGDLIRRYDTLSG